jgi:nucleoside phosphorylase/CheY-like chemotaxis protein
MSTNILNILIVEDDPAKKQKLFQHLQSDLEFKINSEVAVCTEDAIKRMNQDSYDLLILDVVIPAKAGSEPNEKNSLELLERIDGLVGGIKAPKYILPISSISSLSDEAKTFFRGRPWGIISYDEQSNQSLIDIESVIKWIHAHGDSLETNRKCDIFILTALETPEFSELEKAFPSLGPLQPLDSKQLVRFGKITTKDRELIVAIGFCSHMGPVAAAILTSKVVDRLKPRMIIMTGICAGLSDKVNLGDICAAEISWDWQSGKYIDKAGVEAFQNAPHQLGIDQRIRNWLLQLKRDNDFWKKFATASQELKLSIPKLVLGPMATGASVLADARVTNRIKEEQHKNVISLDMETYAVYASSDASPYPVEAISLKAVCDKADSEKGDRYQSYAAMIDRKSVV